MTTNGTHRYTVSGEGIDKGGYPSGMVALSAAINLAQRHPAAEPTLYVRDPAGVCFGRVERHADGVVHVVRVQPDPRRST